MERVGESKKRKVDIRIIAASNKDVWGLVKKGAFREDLYYRLKVFPIHLPPLRDRKNDIPLLISHFISRNGKNGKAITGVTQAAMRIMMDYDWPGNVRELENAIEHAFVLCSGAHIDVFDLPVDMRRLEYRPLTECQAGSNKDPRRGRQPLDRDDLLLVHAESKWNKAETARRLGCSRAAIWKYMKKWDISTNMPG